MKYNFKLTTALKSSTTQSLLFGQPKCSPENIETGYHWNPLLMKLFTVHIKQPRPLHWFANHRTNKHAFEMNRSMQNKSLCKKLCCGHFDIGWSCNFHVSGTRKWSRIDNWLKLDALLLLWRCKFYKNVFLYSVCFLRTPTVSETVPTTGRELIQILLNEQSYHNPSSCLYTLLLPCKVTSVITMQ